jgi:hypothetical protein
MSDTTRIGEPRIEHNARGDVQRVDLLFGPNHFIRVYIRDGRLLCDIGSTHRGVTLDATGLPGEFEKAVYTLEAAFPRNQMR